VKQLCDHLQQRLENVWSRLQRLEQSRHEPISQFDLDEECVHRLEQFVAYLEAESSWRNRSPVAAGVVCNCPSDSCPAHGRVDNSELKHGGRVRE
jgi:hypothetical protein